MNENVKKKVWLAKDGNGNVEVYADEYGIGAGHKVKGLKDWKEGAALLFAKKYAKEYNLEFMDRGLV